MAKRYILLEADGGLSDGDVKELAKILEDRYGNLKLIQVQGNRRMVIVKMTAAVAPFFREHSGQMRLGGKELVSVLTSGAIGKLKRRAAKSEKTGNGQIP